MQRGTDFFDALRELSESYSQKIFMCDLNADLTKDISDALTIRRLVADLSLRLVDHGPTHGTPASRTWLDVILVDENDSVSDFGSHWLPSFGKHSIIDVTIGIHTPARTVDSFEFRDYKGMDSASLAELLSCCDWTAMESIEADLEGAIESLNVNLNLVMDKLAPVKRVTPKKKYPPWIGPLLRQLIDKRDATRRRYERTGRVELFDEFFRLSNEVDERLDQERTSFLHQHLSDAMDDKKNIWKELRKLGLLPKRNVEELHGFSPGELNDHFAGISVSSLENIDDATDIILTANEEGFSFKPVTIGDVVLAISHFSSQARGADGVPKEVIVEALPIIGEFIVKIFNSSFAQGIFPRAWKQAQVIALKKK